MNPEPFASWVVCGLEATKKLDFLRTQVLLLYSVALLLLSCEECRTAEILIHYKL